MNLNDKVVAIGTLIMCGLVLCILVNNNMNKPPEDTGNYTKVMSTETEDDLLVEDIVTTKYLAPLVEYPEIDLSTKSPFEAEVTEVTDTVESSVQPTEKISPTKTASTESSTKEPTVTPTTKATKSVVKETTKPTEEATVTPTETPTKEVTKSSTFENDFSSAEVTLMYQIVEAEVTGDCYYSEKYNVACTIFNRLKDDAFPDTLYGILTAGSQFSTYSSGRYLRVEVTETTKKAVQDAYVGNDTTYGALFFDVCGGRSWAATHKTYIFTDGLNINYYK